MNQDERNAATSFILGYTHGAIANILYVNEAQKTQKLHELHKWLTDKIGELYYANPNNPDKHL